MIVRGFLLDIGRSTKSQQVWVIDVFSYLCVPYKTTMTLLYNFGIILYSIAIRLAAFFNPKAKLLVAGRKQAVDSFKKLTNIEGVIWFHVASLGEFEQGRPLIEAIKKKYPEKKILLTFFSPSGYEVRKNFALADYIYYLPSDNPSNASLLLDTFKPTMAFFVKYEFWYHYLKALHQRNIPVYGVSVIFREHQPFFKWYGGWYRQILGFYKRFYLQDELSLQLLMKAGYNQAVVCGDTRFDRVAEIAANSKDDETARRFTEGCSKVIIAGSTWYKDEQLLAGYLNANEDVKLVLVPHEVHDEHVAKAEVLFTVPVFRYTNAPEDVENYRVMIINTIGLLSSIYKYGQVAYIGGGFGAGIHNTLEAATYSMPVVFGPRYHKFKEAVDLIEKEGGFTVSDYFELSRQMDALLNSPTHLNECGQSAGTYVKSMCGATDLIMKELF
jgi:3-deoxy-D-manno-octulosonic-acid transferase